MNVGTKSILFGVHQFLIHPIFVARAWWILYRQWPALYEWAAIITHDLGYWGAPNMDGLEGQAHPERMAQWWTKHFGEFGERVAFEILGHSRFYAKKYGVPLSKLFRPDKLATALYPKWLYLLLGNLTGEIEEYMWVAVLKEGKRKELHLTLGNQLRWLIEMQAHLALMGLYGSEYDMVKEQMDESSD